MIIKQSKSLSYNPQFSFKVCPQFFVPMPWSIFFSPHWHTANVCRAAKRLNGCTQILAALPLSHILYFIHVITLYGWLCEILTCTVVIILCRGSRLWGGESTYQPLTQDQECMIIKYERITIDKITYKLPWDATNIK